MTSEISDKTLDLIAKLHALANDRAATEAEATTALQKMQALLFRHNITLDDVSLRTNKSQPNPPGVGEDYTSNYERTNRNPGSGFKTRGARLTRMEREWRERLAGAIARTNFCRILVTPEFTAVFFVGAPHNIAAVKEIWEYACEQVDQLSYDALKARRKNATQRASEGHLSGKDWRRNWLFGCIERLELRLWESWRELQQQYVESKALIIVNDDAINEYIEERTKGKKISNRKETTGYRGAGYDAGYAAGAGIDLTAPRRKIS